MATIAETPTPPAPKRRRSRRETRNDGGTALSTYGLLAPMLIVLGILFVAPLYYIFLFSVALKRFSPTDALANLNGELNAFSTDLWTKLVSVDVTVMVPGRATNLSILVDANDGASENAFHKLSIELS